MSNRWFLTALIALAITGCQQMHMGHKKDKESEGPEEKIQWAQVPPNVQATLAKESNGAKIETVDKEMKDGKTVYEADAMVDGKNWEIKVGEDGKLIAKKLDPEEDEKAEKPENGKKEDKD